MGLITKIFGTPSEREVKKLRPVLAKIEALDEPYRKLSDAELKAKTPELKARLAAGETLDDILPEAFAAVREAAWRVLGMRPYHVQLVGGIILHQGRIAEMKTGEGKTLVAILPAYLNALTGKGVHIVTVNDYLAKRDSEWMGKVYRFMGLSVGLIIHDKTQAERREAYLSDITYCTNNELGFDYLRDNMALYKKDMVQRGHSFAIVDEVDSILIDEARTPLIISGKGEESSKLYEMADFFVSRLRKKVYATTDDKEAHDDDNCDYYVDEKERSVQLTASGIKKAEEFFNVENLADIENSTLSHHINQALKARGYMKKDVDYVVKDGQVIIVDESTGRLMYGRRYNEGLHQAIEAKEGVTVANESKTLATITFQNFFRLYDKLSGMTGTALTEEEEFSGIYALDVVEIPTNRPVIRIDHPDVVYKTEAGKLRAVIRQIKECHAKGQPVLVGTISIEKSEHLSHLLDKERIPHVVLNAKFHEKEAEIVAQAGKLGAVTIATNMAGRGTDIVLGGNPDYLALSDLRRREDMTEELLVEANAYSETDDPEILAVRRDYETLYKQHKAETDREGDQVRAVGGLFIVGTERHESRRIDNQLRGRSGRQGDPGESRFYLSMEDDVMRLFGSERIQNMMESLGLDEDTPIDAKILSGAIENAQKTVESRNYQTRKNVLEYDDVMNTQRKVIYEQRLQVLNGEDLSETIKGMFEYVVRTQTNAAFMGGHHLESLEQLRELLAHFDGKLIYPGAWVPAEADLKLSESDVQEKLLGLMEQAYQDKETLYGAEKMREIERVILLRVVDEYWMDNIDAMADLRRGIGLRSYGQNDPVIAYKKEGYEMFDAMISDIREETVRRLFSFRLRTDEEPQRKKVATITATGGAGDKTVKKQPVVKKVKIGPNDPCPCGSGKKYKKCCRDKDLAAQMGGSDQ